MPVHAKFAARFGVMLAAAAFAAAAHGQANTQDARARAAAVEAQMTDDQRLTLLHGVMALPGTVDPWPEGALASAGYVSGVPSLGVPPLRMTDASLGVTNPLQSRAGDTATAYPSGLAIASSFDPARARRLGVLIGEEARARGFNVLLGGGVNLTRDPRGGRNYEYLGEDPFLAGILAGQLIDGVQSTGVISTVKHFSLNAQETLRQSANAVIEDAAHRQSDLLAFQIAIETGRPGSVMCAFNLVNGAPSCGSSSLLRDILKEEWGFDGWVMSDWGTTGSADYFNAGLDQQMGEQIDQQVWFGEPLRAEIEAGRVSRERFSDGVQRILRAIYQVGADRDRPPPQIDYDAHAREAREAASAGMVLLKNDGVLPLANDARAILVVGGYSDVGVMSGAGSSQVTPRGGAAALIPVGGPGFLESFGRQLIVPSSPLAALREALPNARISFDGGYFPETSAAYAAHADLVIVFATQWQTEGLDASSLSLPIGQDALIAGIAAANPNTIVVLETGNPVLMPWLENVRAVVQAWYPGQQGGPAIADILTGAVNPSGRLPMTFPAGVEQLPRPALDGLGLADRTPITVNYMEGDLVGYRWHAARGHPPLFPFGHGLSYTRFAHSGLAVTRSGDRIRARFSVANAGDRAGADAPQLYLVDAAGRAVQRLVGFVRTPVLRPGARRSFTIDIDPLLLADWSDGEWLIRDGVYRFALGRSATDLGPTTAVRLAERRIAPGLRTVRGDAGR